MWKAAREADEWSEMISLEFRSDVDAALAEAQLCLKLAAHQSAIAV